LNGYLAHPSSGQQYITFTRLFLKIECAKTLKAQLPGDGEMVVKPEPIADCSHFQLTTEIANPV